MRNLIAIVALLLCAFEASATTVQHVQVTSAVSAAQAASTFQAQQGPGFVSYIVPTASSTSPFIVLTYSALDCGSCWYPPNSTGWNGIVLANGVDGLAKMHQLQGGIDKGIITNTGYTLVWWTSDQTVLPCP